MFHTDYHTSILWTAVFGIFGKMYIHEHAEGDGGIKRMKNAVWIDLVNMLLWLVSAIMAAVLFFTLRGGKSLHSKCKFFTLVPCSHTDLYTLSW